MEYVTTLWIQFWFIENNCEDLNLELDNNENINLSQAFDVTWTNQTRDFNNLLKIG